MSGSEDFRAWADRAHAESLTEAREASRYRTRTCQHCGLVRRSCTAASIGRHRRACKSNPRNAVAAAAP